MNRRVSIRNATLLAVGMALGKYDTLRGKEGGALTVDLGQWDHVSFKLGHNVVNVPVKEVFDALVVGRTLNGTQ